MYVCMYVCVFVCMYQSVCVYVCVYVSAKRGIGLHPAAALSVYLRNFFYLTNTNTTHTYRSDGVEINDAAVYSQPQHVWAVQARVAARSPLLVIAPALGNHGAPAPVWVVATVRIAVVVVCVG